MLYVKVHKNNIEKALRLFKKQVKESKLLALNCNKAAKLLKWKPKMNFKETINLTLEWYRQYHRNFYCGNENVYKLSSYQIRYYEKNFR